MMTSDELQAIKARAEAATPGPWRLRFWHVGNERYAVAASEDYREIGTWVATDMSESDCLFCVHAREDVPALVAEVERLRSEVDHWKEEARLNGQEIAEYRGMIGGNP